MSILQLDPKKTALVLIDLQNAVVARPAAPHSAADVIRRASQLARTFRDKGATVVYVRVDLANFIKLPVDQPTRDPNAPPPPPEASELVPEAGFEDVDLLVTKRHWGAFGTTDLEAQLRERGIDTIVLGGIATNIGVESTAREAAARGIAVVVVEDATTTMDAAVHRASFELIFPRIARVRTTDEVLAAFG